MKLYCTICREELQPYGYIEKAGPAFIIPGTELCPPRPEDVSVTLVLGCECETLHRVVVAKG